MELWDISAIGGLLQCAGRRDWTFAGLLWSLIHTLGEVLVFRRTPTHHLHSKHHKATSFPPVPAYVLSPSLQLPQSVFFNSHLRQHLHYCPVVWREILGHYSSHFVTVSVTFPVHPLCCDGVPHICHIMFRVFTDETSTSGSLKSVCCLGRVEWSSAPLTGLQSGRAWGALGWWGKSGCTSKLHLCSSNVWFLFLSTYHSLISHFLYQNMQKSIVPLGARLSLSVIVAF